MERRKRLDVLGGRYPLPEHVQVEAADANGVAAEWTMTPEAEGALAKVGASVRISAEWARSEVKDVEYPIEKRQPYARRFTKLTVTNPALRRKRVD